MSNFWNNLWNDMTDSSDVTSNDNSTVPDEAWMERKGIYYDSETGFYYDKNGNRYTGDQLKRKRNRKNSNNDASESLGNNLSGGGVSNNPYYTPGSHGEGQYGSPPLPGYNNAGTSQYGQGYNPDRPQGGRYGNSQQGKMKQAGRNPVANSRSITDSYPVLNPNVLNSASKLHGPNPDEDLYQEDFEAKDVCEPRHRHIPESKIEKAFPPKGDSLPGNAKILENYELRFTADKIMKRKFGTCKTKGCGEPVYVQKAYGILSLYKIENGIKNEILSVTAISGDGGNGCIPNNKYAPGKVMKYYAGTITAPFPGFNDGKGTYNPVTKEWSNEKEHAWKINIYEDFESRGLFRIHPARIKFPKDNEDPVSSNDGCISPYPSENSVLFYNTIKAILSQSNFVIPLFVEIKCNFNITVKVSKYAT